MKIHKKNKSREVSKNNLLGGQFLIFFAQKTKQNKKIINWVGSLQFVERSNPNDAFFHGKC